jgi:hypothetical protein
MFRIQVATYGWLTDEIMALTGDEASRRYAQLTREKYDAGEAMGGAVIRRASDPRVWDVPVGDRIRPDNPIDDATCATCQRQIADHEDACGVWHGCRGARAQHYTEQDVTAIAQREGEEVSHD